MILKIQSQTKYFSNSKFWFVILSFLVINFFSSEISYRGICIYWLFFDISNRSLRVLKLKTSQIDSLKSTVVNRELCFFLGTGSESQLVCSGCRNLLLYPIGATSVCCAVCNSVTAVPPPGLYKMFEIFRTYLYR